MSPKAICCLWICSSGNKTVAGIIHLDDFIGEKDDSLILIASHTLCNAYAVNFNVLLNWGLTWCIHMLAQCLKGVIIPYYIKIKHSSRHNLSSYLIIVFYLVRVQKYPPVLEDKYNRKVLVKCRWVWPCGHQHCEAKCSEQAPLCSRQGIQDKNWLTLSVWFSWGFHQELAEEESQSESPKAFTWGSFEKWRELPPFIQSISESFELHLQMGPKPGRFLTCMLIYLGLLQLDHQCWTDFSDMLIGLLLPPHSSSPFWSYQGPFFKVCCFSKHPNDGPFSMAIWSPIMACKPFLLSPLAFVFLHSTPAMQSVVLSIHQESWPLLTLSVVLYWHAWFAHCQYFMSQRRCQCFPFPCSLPISPMFSL